LATGQPTTADSGLYIGLMSGTSLDGVDGVLLAIHPRRPLQVVAAADAPLPRPLRDELLALNRPGPNELHRAAVAADGLVRVYAQVVAALLARSGQAADTVRAIGAHGQTVRHVPGGSPAYTLQLNQPALLAELSGITVVADFRSRDVAAGGQGAPLVPAFHRALFGQAGQAIAVVNVGGMANVSALHADGSTRGCDSGPGNVLLDLWCQRHTGQPFDAEGAWAAQGQPQEALLQRLLQEPFFRPAGVKSTGRDLFHAGWLEHHLQACPELRPVDVQATLLELSARSIADTLAHLADQGRWQTVYVCGGGARNAALMQRLSRLLAPAPVLSTEALGWPVSQVEAAAFAWLAQRTLSGQLGNEPLVTGARGGRVLGAIYPA